ncbi:MAG: 3'(2'),5'-bisphosphate nucleotidase CysQ [Proteobacteria bacterium]|nr:3'(2'),5'-bisphosphate nucleotidase CysQ [Pseudomonadota bacterium]
MQTPNATASPPLDDHELLRSAVREAGALALSYFGRDIKKWEKKPDDPVSEADLAVDALLKDRLCGARPGYGWLSEESEDDPARLSAALVWIVDPIDGTRAFLQGKPEFTVCVALVADGAPILGVVFNPATDDFFEAVRGGGARHNGAPITVTSQDAIAGAKLLSSRRTFQKRDWTDAVEHAEFTFLGSMAFRLALVAAGRYDATITLAPKSDWDIAAGDLIITEAGGVITQADGSNLRYNRPSVRHPDVIAAGPALHRRLVEGLAERPLPAS